MSSCRWMAQFGGQFNWIKREVINRKARRESQELIHDWIIYLGFLVGCPPWLFGQMNMSVIIYQSEMNWRFNNQTKLDTKILKNTQSVEAAGRSVNRKKERKNNWWFVQMGEWRHHNMNWIHSVAFGEWLVVRETVCWLFTSHYVC